MSLGSSTPKYLNHIGLIDNDKYVSEDYETDINFLMSQVNLIALRVDVVTETKLNKSCPYELLCVDEYLFFKYSLYLLI